MALLSEWSRDWLDLSGIKPSNRQIDDPITLLQRVFAALAGITAILSSPAISVLVPNLNTNTAIALRIIIALVTLAAVNYVVTAKDVVEATSGFRSQTVRTYRFSRTERLIARGVVGAALLLLILILFRPPSLPATAILRRLSIGKLRRGWPGHCFSL